MTISLNFNFFFSQTSSYLNSHWFLSYHYKMKWLTSWASYPCTLKLVSKNIVKLWWLQYFMLRLIRTKYFPHKSIFPVYLDSHNSNIVVIWIDSSFQKLYLSVLIRIQIEYVNKQLLVGLIKLFGGQSIQESNQKVFSCEISFWKGRTDVRNSQ